MAHTREHTFGGQLDFYARAAGAFGAVQDRKTEEERAKDRHQAFLDSHPLQQTIAEQNIASNAAAYEQERKKFGWAEELNPINIGLSRQALLQAQQNFEQNASLFDGRLQYQKLVNNKLELEHNNATVLAPLLLDRDKARAEAETNQAKLMSRSMSSVWKEKDPTVQEKSTKLEMRKQLADTRYQEAQLQILQAKRKDEQLANIGVLVQDLITGKTLNPGGQARAIKGALELWYKGEEGTHEDYSLWPLIEDVINNPKNFTKGTSLTLKEQNYERVRQTLIRGGKSHLVPAVDTLLLLGGSGSRSGSSPTIIFPTEEGAKASIGGLQTSEGEPTKEESLRKKLFGAIESIQKQDKFNKIRQDFSQQLNLSATFPLEFTTIPVRTRKGKEGQRRMLPILTPELAPKINAYLKTQPKNASVLVAVGKRGVHIKLGDTYEDTLKKYDSVGYNTWLKSRGRQDKWIPADAR